MKKNNFYTYETAFFGEAFPTNKTLIINKI